MSALIDYDATCEAHNSEMVAIRPSPLKTFRRPTVAGNVQAGRDPASEGPRLARGTSMGRARSRHLWHRCASAWRSPTTSSREPRPTGRSSTRRHRGRDLRDGPTAGRSLCRDVTAARAASPSSACGREAGSLINAPMQGGCLTPPGPESTNYTIQRRTRWEDRDLPLRTSRLTVAPRSSLDSSEARRGSAHGCDLEWRPGRLVVYSSPAVSPTRPQLHELSLVPRGGAPGGPAARARRAWDRSPPRIRLRRYRRGRNVWIGDVAPLWTGSPLGP